MLELKFNYVCKRHARIPVAVVENKENISPQSQKYGIITRVKQGKHLFILKNML